MTCTLSNEQIQQIVEETLVDVLSATGMQKGREYGDSQRENYVAIYETLESTGAIERLVEFTQKQRDYLVHRAAIRRFVEAIIRPLAETLGKHQYTITIDTTTVIEDCYPFYAQVNDSGLSYSILLPHGPDIDLGHIVFAKGTGTSNIQLVAQGGETISGTTTLALSGAYDTVLLSRRSNGWTRLALASGAVVNTERGRYELPFLKPAPNNGYLAVGTPPTSSVPMLVTRNGDIDTLSVSVDQPANGNWTLDVRDAITSSLVAQLTLLNGQTEAQASGLGISVSTGDRFIVSINGVTRSNFRRGMATVDIVS